jgi:hypothetical protein
MHLDHLLSKQAMISPHLDTTHTQLPTVR